MAGAGKQRDEGAQDKTTDYLAGEPLPTGMLSSSSPAEAKSIATEYQDAQPNAVERAADALLAWSGDSDAQARRDAVRADAAIERDIADLLRLPTAGLAGVTVAVRDGTATLAGRVRSPQQRDRAEDLTRAVTGVRQVRNEIET